MGYIELSGVLSSAIPWKVLKSSYNDNRVYQDEIRKLLGSHRKDKTNILHFKEEPFSDINVDNRFNHDQGIQPVSDKSTQNKQMKQSPQENNFTGSEVKSATISSDRNLLNNFYDKFSSTVFSPTGLGSMLREQRKIDDWKAKSFASQKHTTQKVPNLVHTLDFETKEFMSELMDEFTHLANYSVPVDPSLIISVVAEMDSYVPRENLLCLQKLWPGSDIRYLPDGHILSILKGQNYFRQAILDSLDRCTQKYYK